MKFKILVVLSCLLLFSSCTQRSIPTRALQTSEPVDEHAMTVSTDLTPLTESSLGQAVVGVMREVETVVITKISSEEVVYESTDDVLSQGIYDAIQLVEEELEVMDLQQNNYEVSFTTSLGMDKKYSLWINFSQEDHVIAQYNDMMWSLPLNESNWIRAKISGLA